MRVLASFCAAVVVTAFCACSDDATTATTASDAGADTSTSPPRDSGGTPDEDAGGDCTDLMLEGPIVSLTDVDGGAPDDGGDAGAVATMPEPTGGAVADGTYVLTAILRYSGGTLPTGRDIFRLANGEFEQSTSDVKTFNLSGTWETSGTTFHQTVICVAGPDAKFQKTGLYSHGYDATDTELRFHITTPPYNSIIVYTKK